MAQPEWSPRERYELIEAMRENPGLSEWLVCKRHGRKHQRSTTSVNKVWTQSIRPILIKNAGWDRNMDKDSQPVVEQAVKQQVKTQTNVVKMPNGRVAWTPEEDEPILKAICDKDPNLTDTDVIKTLYGIIPNRTDDAIRNRWIILKDKIKKGTIRL